MHQVHKFSGSFAEISRILIVWFKQKLESELQVLEEKFEAKKKRIQDSSQEFLKKYDEVCGDQ